MPAPSSRLLPAITVVSVIVVLAMATARLQHVPTDSVASGVETVPEYSLAVEAGTAAVVTLIVGGLMIALAPRGTRSLTDQALETPGIAFVVGFLGTVLTFVVVFALALTGIGILLAIPLLLVYAVLAFVGGELGLLTVGRLVADEWGPILAVAVGVSAFVGGVPYLGSLLGLVVFSIGLGVLFMWILGGEW